MKISKLTLSELLALQEISKAKLQEISDQRRESLSLEDAAHQELDGEITKWRSVYNKIQLQLDKVYSETLI